MDLLTLAEPTYLPSGMIQKWSSLVWTERYLEPGDFQLVTYDVANTMTKLPLDSLVTLRDTKEVMVVETHEIARDSKNVPVLTVKGRSLQVFYEYRNADVLNNVWVTAGFWPIDTVINTALKILYDDFVDAAWPNGDIPPGTVWQYWMDNTGVSDSTTVSTGNETVASSVPDVTLTKVLDLLRKVGCGLRTLRPNTPSANLIALTSRGNGSGFSKTVTANVTKLLMDVYNGKDRTAGQSTNTKVIFDDALGHFQDSKYLFSIVGYRNNSIIYPADADSQDGGIYRPGTSIVSPGFTPFDPAIKGRGWKNTWIRVDAPKFDDNDPNFIQRLQDQGLADLAKKKKTAIFDGRVSDDVPYKFRTHYDLGDLVTVKGDFGITAQTMRVDNYIRSEDKTGERGYPTLVQV